MFSMIIAILPALRSLRNLDIAHTLNSPKLDQELVEAWAQHIRPWLAASTAIKTARGSIDCSECTHVQFGTMPACSAVTACHCQFKLANRGCERALDVTGCNLGGEFAATLQAALLR